MRGITWRTVVLLTAGLLTASQAGAAIVAETSFEAPPVGSSSFAGNGEMGWSATPIGEGDGAAHVAAEQPRTGEQSLKFDDQEARTDFSLVFEPVDVSAFTDVEVSFWWRAPGSEYEAAGEAGEDLMSAQVSWEDAPGSPLTLLDISGAEMDDNDAYELASVAIPDEATAVALSIEASTSFGDESENLYIDDVTVTGIPEPATLALAAIGGLALLRRRR